jgi:hypothetical protein
MTDVIGRADHYAQFVALCRARIAALNLTHASIDALAGFPCGYTSTLLSGGKAMSVYSFFTMARVLALSPAFFHDDAELVKLKARSDWIELRRSGPRSRRKFNGAQYGAHKFDRPRFMREIAALGAIGLNSKLSAKQRSASARRAAKARWRRKG